MIEVLSQESSVLSSVIPSVIAISSPDGGDANRAPELVLVLVQLPVSAGFDRQSQPYQCRLLEMAPDQHQADRQTIDAAAWHGEGRMPGNVERAGIGLHVQGDIDHGIERCIGRRAWG